MLSLDRLPECPSAEELVCLVEGGLDVGAILQLERHIDHCESCRVAMSGLALGSTMRPSSPGSDHVGLARIDAEHYELGQELARGGMGRIFRARDRRLGRDIAIKETFNRSGDARLEREARITGRLQHPSIVQVHEAGVWPTGEPFFAMQLLPGRSLDDAITAAKTLEERLALVPNALAVADAIAYAHSRGVIHRDLKPRNVIVGEFGETVVIDWGLAKDLSAAVSEPNDSSDGADLDDGQTAVGAVIGTPAYMPPEQALGEVVDQRADVYALGAILYHMLSGRPPITGSARDAVLATVVAGGVEPLASAQQGVPADLLAIVAKAMAFEPAHRYADARELAQDLRKFQTGQLVGARRYAWPHLVARWLRRHRTAVAVAAVALVVLAVVGTVSLREIVGAERTAQTERADAEQNRGDAEDLLTFMLGDLHDKLQPLGKTDLLDEVATKAIGYYHRRGDHGSLAERHKIGVALTNVGDVLVDEGHSAAGLAQYRAALAIAQTLSVLEPANPAWRKALATRHERIGDVLVSQGKNADALGEFRAELALSEPLAASKPDDLKRQRDLDVAHFKLAGVLTEMGRIPEAIGQYRAGLAISEHVAAVAPSASADRDLALDHAQLGMALVNHGEYDEAVAQHRAALTVLDRALGRDPSDAQTQATLLATHMTLGEILDKGNDHAGAAAEFRAAIAIGEPLGARDAANVGTQSNVAFCRTELAESEHALGNDAAALDDVNKALGFQVPAAAQDAAQLDRLHDVEISHRVLGKILLARGDRPAAFRELQAVLELATQIAAKEPNSAAYRWDVGDAHAKLGEAKAIAGDNAAAAIELRASLASRQAAAKSDPTNHDYAMDVAGTRAELGEVLEASDAVAALAEYRAALPAFEQAGERDPALRSMAEQLRANIAKLLAHPAR